MFQPEVKLEFVRRYCPPSEGWRVYVDIDASEEGRTGGARITSEARLQQQRMIEAAVRVRAEFKTLGVQIGGCRTDWHGTHGLPPVAGDRDIVAFHEKRGICLIVEAEGASSGQPETKLYKAIGQLVMAASSVCLREWTVALVLVANGNEITEHLNRATALTKLDISALALDDDPQKDQWCFPDALLPKLLLGEPK